MEKLLYLACSLLAVGLQIRRSALRGIFKQLFHFLSLFPDGILVDFDDVEESGRALCLTVFDKRELLVIAEIKEGIRLFRIRCYFLVFRNQILHDVHASLCHILVIIDIVGLFGYYITQVIFYECRNLLGSDIALLQVDFVLALYRQPNGVCWIWVIAHTPYTTAESQVAPGGEGTDVGTAVHAKLEVRNGVEVQIAAEKLLGNAVDGTLWQTDSQTAGIGAGAAGEVGYHHRIINLIDTQFLEEGVDVGEIFLWDIAHLNLLFLGETDYVVAIVAQVFGYFCEEIRGVVAVAQWDVGIPEVLFQTLCIGLLVGIAALPGFEIGWCFKCREGGLVVLQWQSRSLEID